MLKGRIPTGVVTYYSSCGTVSNLSAGVIYTNNVNCMRGSPVDGLYKLIG